jgi:hypothetical protein
MATPMRISEMPSPQGAACLDEAPPNIERRPNSTRPMPRKRERFPGCLSGSGRSRMARTIFRLLTRQDEKSTVTNESETPRA